MTTLKMPMALVLLGLAAGLLGCQPAPTRQNELKIGRTARGPVGNTVNGRATSYQSGNGTTQWGQITSQGGDQAFDAQLNTFTSPMLTPAGDALGYVSATANQSTNVVFWGEASMYSSAGGALGTGTGTLDGSKARIHIEIWDDKAVAGQASPVIVHIGADYPGFQSATGSTNGSQTVLTFTDGYGSVALQGTISGQYFSGTIYFTNDQTGSEYYPLGQFQVPTCGFFVCN